MTDSNHLKNTTQPTRWLLWLILLLGLGGLGYVGIVPKIRQSKARAQMHAEAQAPRRVVLTRSLRAPATTTITLPGTTTPFQQTEVYAKANGYIRKIHINIGDKVTKNQLLAELDVPESNEELRVARTRLDEAQTNAPLITRIAERQKSLATQGILSAIEGEQAEQRAVSAQSAIQVSRAEVQRIEALRTYQRVLSPFDGTISKRNVDVGALVSATSGVLFEISDTHILKVFIDVPQSLASLILPNLETEVFAPATPTQIVQGKVIRTAGILDPAIRTLRTEIHIPGDGPLLAGSFVQVRLKLQQKMASVLVPASALLIRKEGTHVVEVTREQKLKIIPILVGRDLGKEVEVLSGLSEGVSLVANPADDVTSGEVVRIAETNVPGSK